MRGLTAQQIALQIRNGFVGGQLGLAPRGRRSAKWCKRCSRKHAGFCGLTATGHGTRARPDLLETVEQRFAERG